MNENIKPAIISTLVVVLFATMFHSFLVEPHNWKGFLIWLPVYVSPIWGITTYTIFSDRRKN